MTKSKAATNTSEARDPAPTRSQRQPQRSRAIPRDATSGGSTRGRAPLYDVSALAAKWRSRWEEQRLYQIDLRHAKRPYYNLMMFPYPSAEGLHIGNMYAYVGSDVHGSWQAMRGNDVFEPIGFDAFGIHSENFAIKQGIHPRIMTARNIERFRAQLESIGARFDWTHEVQSTDPAYYRWTQWIFVQLFKAGLVERRKAAVNWCPKDKTVLADEQVIAGRCERCGTLVERRELEQWFFKITRYADRLLQNLDQLDWSERVKVAQRAWIGRSEGLRFTLAIEGATADETVSVYTTRPDTIFGVTFVALAPQHPLVERITNAAHREAVSAYLKRIQQVSAKAIEETEEAQRPMTGVFTGAYAIHPLTGEQVPIWIADYVMMEYGEGAIMAVPAHDERDLAFAHMMGLPVRAVVTSTSEETVRVTVSSGGAFTDDGKLAQSGQWTGLTSAEARAAITTWFEEHGRGERAVTYHLRDWLISRQRYWGTPIPIIYCPEHGAVPVPEDQLPVLLPESEEYAPSGTGASPLASIESFVNTTCPICDAPARRETDVSDNFLDSAWYFLRYPSSDDANAPWDPAITRKWLPVNMYVGGAEHSVLHMMYARFITMALHDLGHLDFEEPFPHFRANGTITNQGAKMSKSKGNVIRPDAYIQRYGADVFRTYLLFMGPYEGGGDFSDAGMGGVVRFLDRVWSFVTRQSASVSKSKAQGEARRALHAVIQHVTDDMGAFKYNTAIAALMKYFNGLEGQADVTIEEVKDLLLLLAPFAPFITEELWEHIGQNRSIHTQRWPSFDPAVARAVEMIIIAQVNGRLRDRIAISTEAPEAEVTRLALASPNVQRALTGQTPSQVIYVPERVVNIVTS